MPVVPARAAIREHNKVDISVTGLIWRKELEAVLQCFKSRGLEGITQPNTIDMLRTKAEHLHVSPVGKRDGETFIQTQAADHLRLILHDRPVAGFAGLDLLQPVGFQAAEVVEVEYQQQRNNQVEG